MITLYRDYNVLIVISGKMCKVHLEPVYIIHTNWKCSLNLNIHFRKTALIVLLFYKNM